MTPSFQYKKVNSDVVHHPRERRGFVRVPLDYGEPDGESLQVFYRLIPAYESTHDDSKKPIIVVFNGGPGIPSSAYRALDFDYENSDSEKNGSLDRFKYLLKTHRILIADQRGTDGQSAPLDLADQKLNGYNIARYFSSDFQARDYAKIIETVIPKNENFFIISQSYGGMVGMQYLSLDGVRKPKHLFFTCSALPYEDSYKQQLNRRQEQLNLNRTLKKANPEIDQKLFQVREHLKANGLDPQFTHALYQWLGKYESGIWESKFLSHLHKILTMEKPALELEFKDSVGVGNVLNYILSSSNFTPGETDRSLAIRSSKDIPFEPWMLDENWTLLQIGKGMASTERVIAEIDKTPPTPTPFLKPEELRDRIKNFQVTFVSADNDAYVPAEAFQRSYQKYLIPGHTQTAHLPGGHHAIFLEAGSKLFQS